MSDIVLSPGVCSNILQLQQTSALITQTQTQLATGKKVNSVLDNPINFLPLKDCPCAPMISIRSTACPRVSIRFKPPTAAFRQSPS
jgi:hypothetical protein